MARAASGAVLGVLGVLAHATDAEAQVRPSPMALNDVGGRQLARGTNDWMAALLAGTSFAEPRRDYDAKSFADGITPPPAIDLVPRASVVVRDWRGSMALGGPATVLDDVRPSSTRTLLVRVASGSRGARVAPFLQAGVGQWRFDPTLFPSLGVKDRVAASVGAGLQVRVAGLALAAEVQHTALYDDLDTSLDDMEGAFFTLRFAARARF